MLCFQDPCVLIRLQTIPTTKNTRVKTSNLQQRELKSVSFAFRSFAPILHNSSVKLYTDNKAVAFITDSGSNKPHLNTIAKDIFCLTSAHGIRLSVEWIPRTLNQKADYYSKIVDFDDWCVSNDCFRAIDSRWGPFTVDCFASYANTKLPRFLSIRAFTVLTVWV